MKHLLRSILAGLLCASVAFSILVGCDNTSSTKRTVDSGGVTEGDQTWNGTKTLLGNAAMVGSNATALVIHSAGTSTVASTSVFFGTPMLGGPRVRQLDQNVSVNGFSTAMSTQIPAGAIILSVQGLVLQTITPVVGGGNGVTWSLGPAGGTINAYGTAGSPSAANSLAAGSKSWWLNSGMTYLSSANAVTVYFAQTGGSSASTTNFGSGVIRIVVTYFDCGSLGAAEY